MCMETIMKNLLCAIFSGKKIMTIFQIGFDSLQKVFSPEWINRIDEIIAFRPLSSETLRQRELHQHPDVRRAPAGVRLGQNPGQDPGPAQRRRRPR